MSLGSQPAVHSNGPAFNKEVLFRGEPTSVRCVQIGGQVFTLSTGSHTVARLEDEWYEDLKNPDSVIAELTRRRDLGIDLLTFVQRLPEIEPKYGFHYDYEEIAALKVTSYERWWTEQIKSRIRTRIRKSEKEGLVVKEVAYDDEFVRGMTRIFNESPVRQGRKFWHFGKDFSTVKRQFSAHVHRERMIAAYLGKEMVGFIMLGDAGRFALLGQIISSLRHRDKAPNTSLVAKAVELCAQSGVEHLVYYYWTDDSLAEFKRRCGFQREAVPRYYVPLTLKGRVALSTGAYRGLVAMLPPRVKRTLKRWRSAWYAFAPVISSTAVGLHFVGGGPL